jgi:hypothetical protein
MKRSLVLIMALLLAAPALGTVTITCTDAGSGVLQINYDVSGEPAKVRALALDITVDSGVIFSDTDANSYSGGEGNKYGIFPGKIDLTDPNTPIWGDPIAPSSDPGAGGTGLGTSRVIIEMGSLYEPNLSGPGDSGTLIQLDLDPNGATECNVVIVTEATRGGVVLENGDTPGITSPGCSISFGEPPPACWGYTWQCDGDAGGDDYPAASMPNNFVNLDDFYRLRDSFYLNYWTHPMGTNPGEYNPCSDHNQNGYVNLDDFYRLRDNFYQAPGVHGCTSTPTAPGFDGRWPPVQDH